MSPDHVSHRGIPPGPLVIDVDGLQLTAEDRELLAHPLTGGMVLFARNFHNCEQLSELTREIRAARQGPLLITVDQEGGRVQRFRDGFTRIPPMRRFGEMYDRDPQLAREQLQNAATLLAWELRECGIDLSFAPVVDLDRDICPAIGDRALHSDIEGICTLATAVMDGFAAAGCSHVIKHFPGHGSVDVDTHKDFARDYRSLADIEATDMQPFARLKDRAAAVMMAHVIYDQVDDHPATLSAIWQTRELRQKLQFQGAIFSDDLSMSAITRSMAQSDAAAQALAAGSDYVLICNDRTAAIAAYERDGIVVGDQRQIDRRLSMLARDVDPPAATQLAATREALQAMVA